MAVITSNLIIPAVTAWIIDQLQTHVIPAANNDISALCDAPKLFNAEVFLGEPTDVETNYFAVSFANIGGQRYVASGGTQILAVGMKLQCLMPTANFNSATDFETAMQYSVGEFINWWDASFNTLSPTFYIGSYQITPIQNLRGSINVKMPNQLPNGKTMARGWSTILTFEFTSSQATLPPS